MSYVLGLLTANCKNYICNNCSVSFTREFVLFLIIVNIASPIMRTDLGVKSQILSWQNRIFSAVARETTRSNSTEKFYCLCIMLSSGSMSPPFALADPFKRSIGLVTVTIILLILIWSMIFAFQLKILLQGSLFPPNVCIYVTATSIRQLTSYKVIDNYGYILKNTYLNL